METRMKSQERAHVGVSVTTDRLALLRLFICTHEYGTLSTAAQMLGVSQPSASRLLRRLEGIVGARLLDRTSQGVTLTRTGEEFLILARGLVHEWERAIDATKAQHNTVAGHIRVAVSVAVGQSMMAAIAARFIRLHPNVTMEWEVNESQLSLNSSVYDLWIRVGDVDNDQVVVRKIGYAQRALICAAHLGRVEHPRDLESSPAVRISTAIPKYVELRHSTGEKFSLEQRCVFTTDNLYAAREAVREGLGYAVLPLWSVRAELDCGTLVRTCEAWTPPPMLLSFSFLPDGKRPARVTALLEYLKSEFSRGDGAAVEFFR